MTKPRILFLDDNHHRHDVMVKNIGSGADLTRVFTARQAIYQIVRNRFDLIMLDHDLNDATNGQLVGDEQDGRFVCRTVAELFRIEQENDLDFMCLTADTPVIIHSLNPAGAKSMESILKSAGMHTVHQIPFAWRGISSSPKSGIAIDCGKLDPTVRQDC